MKRLIVIICILNLFCVRATQSPFDPGSPFGLAATLFRIILTSSESNYRTFITAINYSGNITTADNLCNSDSLKPNVGTYKAVLASSTFNPMDPLWLAKQIIQEFFGTEISLQLQIRFQIFLIGIGLD